jgi:hypothetical protein
MEVNCPYINSITEKYAEEKRRKAKTKDYGYGC